MLYVPLRVVGQRSGHWQRGELLLGPQDFGHVPSQLRAVQSRVPQGQTWCDGLGVCVSSA